MIFPAGTGLNLTYRFFLCPNPQSDNTVLPTGNEITSPDVYSGQFAGDNIAYTLPFQTQITTSLPYLTLYATNSLASLSFPASIVAIMELKV